MSDPNKDFEVILAALIDAHPGPTFDHEPMLGRPEEDQPADTEQPPHSQYPDECWCDRCEEFLGGNQS